MVLKKTQVEVLKTLYEYKDEYLGLKELLLYGKVKNRSHINSAIYFFLENDLIYQPNKDGKVQISPEGEEVIMEYY